MSLLKPAGGTVGFAAYTQAAHSSHIGASQSRQLPLSAWRCEASSVEEQRISSGQHKFFVFSDRKGIEMCQSSNSPLSLLNVTLSFIFPYLSQYVFSPNIFSALWQLKSFKKTMSFLVLFFASLPPTSSLVDFMLKSE